MSGKYRTSANRWVFSNKLRQWSGRKEAVFLQWQAQRTSQRGFEQAQVLLVVRKLSWLRVALGVVGLGLFHLLQALCSCPCHISHLKQLCRSDPRLGQGTVLQDSWTSQSYTLPQHSVSWQFIVFYLQLWQGVTEAAGQLQAVLWSLLGEWLCRSTQSDCDYYNNNPEGQERLTY